MKFSILCFALITLVPMFSAPSLAQEDESTATEESDIQPLGHYSAWRIYTATQDGEKVCFMAASPLYASPTKRKDAYLMIARRPAFKEYNVVSVMTGVDYPEKSTPTIGVDNNKVFAMFAQKDTAFIKDSAKEKAVIKQMIDGNIARTVGKSKRGTTFKDSYSLKGFTKALDKITKECP